MAEKHSGGVDQNQTDIGKQKKESRLELQRARIFHYRKSISERYFIDQPHEFL